MTEYQKKFLEEVGVSAESLPSDFTATMHYLLETKVDKRNARMFLKRYSGDGVEAIGEAFGVTRQRADVIIKDVRGELLKHKDMLKYGLEGYTDILVKKRADELHSAISDHERNAIIEDAYERGYKNGKKDGELGREENRADLTRVCDISVSRYPFSTRATTIFTRYNIATIGDIINTGDKIASYRGFGKVTFVEICDFLKSFHINAPSIFPRTFSKFKMEW